MLDEPIRYYRKKLTSHGLIYIAGEEIDIAVKNLSITGLLAELSNEVRVQTIEDIFEAISISIKVDLYLPEMRLMGEAEVVRADLIGDHIHLALVFTHITHDVDNVLYKRKNYRKDLVSPGQIVFEQKKYAFTTRNVSVTGLLIHLDEKIEVEEGAVTIFDFKHLNLRGHIKVVWVEDCKDGGTYMGLEYVDMEKTEIKGIPRFERKD